MSIEDDDKMDDFYSWTGIPGKCEGFDGWGKGYPASVACSRHATVIALYPWHGVDEATWLEEKEYEVSLKNENGNTLMVKTQNGTVEDFKG